MSIPQTPRARAAKPRSTLPRRLTAPVFRQGKPRAPSTRAPSSPCPSARNSSQRRRQGRPLRTARAYHAQIRCRGRRPLQRSFSSSSLSSLVLPGAVHVRILVWRIDEKQAVGIHATVVPVIPPARRTHVARYASSVMMPQCPLTNPVACGYLFS